MLLLDHIPDASFPSDHATVSVAFLTSLFLAWYKKTWFIFTPFVIFMLLSRIILWVHWPFDILVWSLVWIFSSFVVFKYITKIKTINKVNKFLIKIMSFIKL
jgi:undecaprenyl-diphosphatase